MILPGLSLLVIGAVCAVLRVRVIPGTLFSVFSLPLLVVPLAEYFGLWVSLALTMVLILTLLKYSFLRANAGDGFFELITVVGLWYPLHHFSSELWPEFYNIGERMRDFAILAEVARNPLFPKDPWCDAFAINYYVYWYRLGALIKSTFGLSVAETYHLLVSFVPAVIFGCALYLFRSVLKFALIPAALAAVVLVFGSNFRALTSVFNGEHWWTPSRAISIGITEFTSWSFLLGDLHPHYLSQMLPIFFLVMAVGIKEYSIKLLMAFGLYASTLTFAANSWDVVPLLIVGAPLALYLSRRSLRSNPGEFSSIVLLLSLSALALASTANLQPVPLSLRLLSAEHPSFTLVEFLSHWGVALVMLITAAAVLGKRKLLNQRFSLLVCFGCSLAIGFASLFFFDDLYSGQHERLNTIFKIYSFLWIPVHLCAVILLLEAWSSLAADIRRDFSVLVVVGSCVMLSVSFFFHTAFVSRPTTVTQVIHPRSEGLSLLAEPEVVQYLRERVTLPILEWNEPAYSDSTIYCSLSERGCYLGWQNHLRIQYKLGAEELLRRQEVVNAVFKGRTSCDETLKLVKAERIGAVVGPASLSLPCFSETRQFSSLKVFIP